jgi:hypothetical protein
MLGVRSWLTREYWSRISGTNTLAYNKSGTKNYTTAVFVKVIKRFVVYAPGPNVIKLFMATIYKCL